MATDGSTKVEVTIIAQFEGVTLYRVNVPNERYVYVAVKGNATQTASWQESCGKSCVQQVEVLGVK